jgi:AcrR family transcriptional regulator
MSPRKPAVLRGGEENLREHLIATAARLIDQRGSAGLSVRDIAREARVADGVLYNYFEDKEDLLAHALLAHVGTVMADAPPVPAAGTATVAENLSFFIDRGLAVLVRVVPAFAGLVSQPRVLGRFHAMVGGDAAFVGTAGGTGHAADGDVRATSAAGGSGRQRDGHDHGSGGPRPAGLPESLAAYLRAEQELGRIDRAADLDAACALIVGAIHGEILPRVLFTRPGTPVATPPGLAAQLTGVILTGIAPQPRHR